MARRGGRFGATGFSIADGRAAHRDRSRDRCRADGTLNHTVSARPPSRVAADFRPVRLLPPPLEVRVLHPKTGLANVYEQAPCRLTLGLQPEFTAEASGHVGASPGEQPQSRCSPKRWRAR
jgi:hypothetical protein